MSVDDMEKCSPPWTEGSYFRKHEVPNHKADLVADAAREEGTELPPPPKKYAFIVYAPAPANIPVRERYYTGIGVARQNLTFVGYGGDYPSAEQAAYKIYEEVSRCDHEWFRHTMSDDDRTMLIDGDCTCRRCGIYVHNLQMHPKVFNAMNLACEAHDGVKRKWYDAHYITHPAEVYSRVAWWRALPEEQWLRMCAAAYLHDVIEDCPQIDHARIIEGCGEDVYRLVLELTNPSKGVQAPRHVRKQMDRDHLRNASWEAKIIKLFDRIANLRDMEKCPDKEFVALYAAESRLLLDCLRDADAQLALQLEGWIISAERIAADVETEA